ncbi:unnamed protein product [Rotaria sp. Silwood2]|nr:unnamed protein product [Rotaria sp. Silwood2]
MSSQHSDRASQKGSSSINPNYTSRILTIIQDQNKKKLPTLILKLQKRVSSDGKPIINWIRDKISKFKVSDDVIEQYVIDNLESLKRELLENIDNFQQLILSARPDSPIESQDPKSYQSRMENYRELLKLATEIAKQMEKSLNDILKQYEQYIEDVWKAICQKQDLKSIQTQFDQSINQNMNQYWKPIFDRADDFIKNINQQTYSQNIQ